MDAPLADVSVVNSDFSLVDAKHTQKKHTKTDPAVNKQCDAQFSLSVDKGSCRIEGLFAVALFRSAQSNSGYDCSSFEAG